jgi:hypothetical protein
MAANASEAPLRELTMALPQEWIALAGVGVGFLGSPLNQWMATGGQRKIKREEEEALVADFYCIMSPRSSIT